MQPELDDKRFGMVRLGNVEAFYRAYHGYLRDNGIDGVKVRARCMHCSRHACSRCKRMVALL